MFLSSDDTPLSIAQLREYLDERFEKGKGVAYEIFDRNREYRESALISFGNLKPQYHNILRKAVSFSPITNITSFISEYICTSPNEIDITAMQQSIRNYTSLEETARITEERVKALEGIQELYKRFDDARRHQRLYSYFLERVRIEDGLERIRRMEESLSDKKNACRSISGKIEEISLILRDIGDKMQDQLEKDIAVLEERKAAILDDASRISEDLMRIRERYTAAISRLREIESVERIPGETGITSIGDVDLQRITELDYIHLSKSVSETKAWFLEKNSQSNLTLQDMKEKETLLRNEILNLRKGIKPYPEDAIGFQKKMESTFSHKFPFLADLIEIEPGSGYQQAIEAFLGDRRFFIIVADDEKEDAEEILRSGFIGKSAGFITPKEAERELAEHPILPLIEAKSSEAGLYIASLFSGLSSEGCPSLGKNGILALPDDTSSIKEEKNLFIGQNAVKRMLEARLDELDELMKRIRHEDQKAQAYALGAAAPSFDDSKASDYIRKAKEISSLSSIEKEIKSKADELNSLDLLALEELDKDIKDAGQTKRTREKEKEDLLSERGGILSAIASLEAAIPERQQEIDKLHDGIIAGFSPEERETAEKEFRKSYQNNENKKNIVEQYSSQLKRFSTAADNAKDNLVTLREGYNRLYHTGLDIVSDSNDEFDEEYTLLSGSRLPLYREKIKEAKDSAYRQFKNDFLNRISDNIKSSELQIKQFNRILSKYHFGEDSYEFSVQSARGYEQYYRMFTSEELTAGTDSLFSEIFIERYQKELDELFTILLPSSSSGNNPEKEKSIQKHIDYKTYLSFDLKVRSSSGSQNLSETLIVKSGGEVQIPFYISVLASFAQICRINDEKRNNTVRLVIFDEAFSKMDGERIRECLRLLKDFDLQVVFSAPPEKTMDIASFADRIIVAYKDGLSSYTRSFAPGDLRNEKEI